MYFTVQFLRSFVYEIRDLLEQCTVHRQAPRGRQRLWGVNRRGMDWRHLLIASVFSGGKSSAGAEYAGRVSQEIVGIWVPNSQLAQEEILETDGEGICHSCNYPRDNRMTGYGRVADKTTSREVKKP